MREMRLAVVLVLLTFGCAREMRLPTEPVDISATSKRTPATDASHRNRVQSATGHVDQTESPFGVTVVDQYSFSAIRTPHGRINGQFEFRAKYQGVVVRAHGEVNCLTINGNKARIGGRVTHSTFEEQIPVGSEVTWTVTDNDEPGRGADTASQLLGFPLDIFCAAPAGSYSEAPLNRGNVQVRP